MRNSKLKIQIFWTAPKSHEVRKGEREMKDQDSAAVNGNGTGQGFWARQEQNAELQITIGLLQLISKVG